MGSYTLLSDRPPIRPRRDSAPSCVCGTLHVPPVGGVVVQVALNQPAVFAGTPLRCSIEVQAGQEQNNEDSGLWALMGLPSTRSKSTSINPIVPTYLAVCLLGVASFPRNSAKESPISEPLRTLREALNNSEAKKQSPEGCSVNISTSEQARLEYVKEARQSVERLLQMVMGNSTIHHEAMTRGACKLLFASDQIVLISERDVAPPSDSCDFYGYECLVPPFIPPTYLGRDIKYQYFLNVEVRTSAGGQKSFQLPVQVVGPTNADIPTMPTVATPPIVPASIVWAAASGMHEDKSSVLSFDFKSRGFKGGNCNTQRSFLSPAMASTTKVDQREQVSIVEGYAAMWTSASDFRKYGHAAYAAFLLNGTPWCKVALDAMAHRALSCWPPLTTSPHAHVHGILEVHQQNSRDAWQQQFSQWQAESDSVDHLPPTTSLWTDNEGEDDEEIERPKKAQFRICQDNKILVVVNVYGKHHYGVQGERILCTVVGGSVSVGLDFATADVTTFEAHAFLVRRENFKDKQANLSSPPSDYTDVTVCEWVEVIGSQTMARFEIFTPAQHPPSFETDIVDVSYYLLFRFYCAAVENKPVKINSVPETISKSKLISFQWRQPIRVLPPHLEDVEGPDVHTGVYSIAGNCSLLGESVGRMQRRVIV